MYEKVRRPTYRALEEHASRMELAFAKATVSDLLNGPATPRWSTVETFVLSCASYARAHRIDVAAALLDVDSWHADYRSMENALADREAQREQIAGGVVRVRKRRVVVPGQLPADVSAFTGRVQHLAELDRLVVRSDPQRAATVRPTAVVISAIDGTAGVGKTALAIHWAHRVREHFPDGQLYVNLRGFDPSGQTMNPADAVRGFLDALEVPPQRIPADLDAQAALYRSLLVGRRVLVVLDNARNSGQVRPLLPGAPGCLVIVTSRNQLSGLVAAHSAHPITLDLLAPAEARELLASRLGPDRVTAEPSAVNEIITRCARLPLALSIVAARAEAHPQFPLRTIAEELSDRLDALAGGEPEADVRTVFSWSYDALTPDTARLFRLLGLHPGPEVSAPAAASLAGLPPSQLRPLLAELARANLIIEHVAGRYTFHDLLRAYAAEQAHLIDPDDQRRDANHRMLDHYLHTAYRAARLLYPQRDSITLTSNQPAANPEHLADRQQALTWFTTEHPVLLAAVNHAAATGWDSHTWQLAWTLTDFLDLQGHWHDLVIVQQAAVDAARRWADPAAYARTHRNLAGAYIALGRYEDAHTHLRDALDLASRAGDHPGQAHAHISLAYLWGRQSRHAEALGHAGQALTLYQAAGHRTGQANALDSVGWHHSQLGDHRQALIYCQQALIVHQELEDRDGQGATWDSLGYAYHHLGQYDKAIACYQHALCLYRDLGDRYYEADTLAHLGNTYKATGDIGTARRIWQEALAILDDLGHPDAEAIRTKLAALN